MSSHIFNNSMPIITAVWNMQLGSSAEHKDVAAVVRFHQGASIDQFPQWQRIILWSSIFFLSPGSQSGGGGGVERECMYSGRKG